MRCVMLGMVWLGLGGSAAAQNGLAEARRLYNAGLFDQAIAAAQNSSESSRLRSATAVIVARSRLERFRTLQDPQELDRARADLAAVNPMQLGPQERMEWQMGLGEALLLDNQPGPASEILSTLVPSTRPRLTSVENEKLLEWLAVSVSRFAQTLSGGARNEQYHHLLTTLAAILQSEPTSRAANYWSVVASRGAGDLEAAWNIAMAGWVRAGSHQASGALRNDLDQFVTQTLIPERAQAKTGQRLDAPATIAEIAAMTEEWRDFTRRWSEED